MGMIEFKVIVGIWLLAQIFIFPHIITDCKKIVLFVDFEALALLIVMYFGFKLIGV